MKPLTDLDHYEVLEVKRDAPAEGIDRAFQLALATYADDSLAGYSVFDPGDAAAMRERIETAYRVLSDAGSRSQYDATLAVETAGESVADSNAAPVSPPLTQPSQSVPAPTVAEPTAEIEPLEAFDEESDEFDGARLRRARLRRGLEIEGVAEVTKVNPTYLRFLEEERFADLPARVYVRGFLMAYAACVGLDANAVAKSYLERFDAAATQEPRRSRGA